MAQTGTNASPAPAGVIDQSPGAAGATLEIHTEPGPASYNDGTPLKQQVIQVEGERGTAQIIALLVSIDRSLKALVEDQIGFVADEAHDV